MDNSAHSAYIRVLGFAGFCPENLFRPGSPCDAWYAAAYEARCKLAQRLDTEYDDADLEALWRALESLQKAVALRMYACGRTAERWRRTAPPPVNPPATGAPARRPPPAQN